MALVLGQETWRRTSATSGSTSPENEILLLVPGLLILIVIGKDHVNGVLHLIRQ